MLEEVPYIPVYNVMGFFLAIHVTKRQHVLYIDGQVYTKVDTRKKCNYIIYSVWFYDIVI